MSADLINASIMNLVKNAQDTVEIYESQQIIPTPEQFKDSFERLRNGVTVSLLPKRGKRKVQIRMSEVADITYPKQDNIQSKSNINKNSDKCKTSEINKNLSFWEVAVEFENLCGRQNNWSESTHEKFHAMRNHLKGLRAYKRKQGLKTFELVFDYFDDEGMLSYLEYLRDVKNLKNSTIEKNMEFLRWFLRWSLQKGFHTNTQFESFRPKFKKTQKKVIFLTKKEIKKMENYKIPDTKLYLYRVRDVFLFCCYTGLRYSDVYNLKKYDVKSDHIEVTTMKTCDSLKIELNHVSKR
ncbi:MAG: phage integrase SAM-like domain-containing protein, partial [Prevotella sp.]|nr:phage integrase SAM-like domain-containing protein [Prevotella sp.]